MITLRSAELFTFDLRLRMPFRYGIATLTELPHAILRVTFEIDGKICAGLAADNLPPKWFTKDPARRPADEIAELIAVTRTAVGHARTVRAATPFAFWHALHEAQTVWGNRIQLPPLLTNFGTSMVERALIDAFCRAKGATLAGALQQNLFGIELGESQAVLAGTAPRDWLPAAPPTEIFARHTVGLSDPIDASDLAAGDRVADGLPQTLVECVRFYGLRHFKIKINGEVARDRDRLARMAALFAAECPDGDFSFTLDGNESFRDAAAFPEVARGLFAAPELRALWPRLWFIEQPWHRDVALTPAVGAALRAWPERPPIIIDESDAESSSLPMALELGYAGTSHKNCKGVFKSVVNACLLARRRATGAPTVLSGEDLTNVGPIGLVQDLAAQAVLGVTSVERNGHHYFAGLSQFPAGLQSHALAHHGDLFTRLEGAGWPRVNVRAGQVALGSVLRAPFGYAGEPDLTGMAREEIG
ncbi:MAG: hypothetical protein NTV51_06490 [Verrucomicrobia bacterium]|nr:hypothetical protein [Verrucomicrobiota bacterium]